jgi:cell division protein ZapA
MSSGANVVSVHILDKEYRIACPPEEHEELLRSANYLSKKMKEIRDSGKVIGTDRIAVMAALNISHDLLKAQSETEVNSSTLGSRIRNLQNKIDAALLSSKQMDL